MKNLVLCFDSTTNRQGPRDATNAETLFRLLDDSADERQLTWYDAGAAALNSPRLFNPAARRWRGNVAAAARESVIDAYFYLAEHWETGDRIFLLGAGRGAYCARALARMLGTVGMMADREDNVVDLRAGRLCAARAEPDDRGLAAHPPHGLRARGPRRRRRACAFPRPVGHRESAWDAATLR